MRGVEEKWEGAMVGLRMGQGLWIRMALGEVVGVKK